MKNYVNRLIENNIKNCLKIAGAVNVVGPKYCGKTRTSEVLAKSSFYIQDYNLSDLIDVLKYSPQQIMEGENPRLIDEWQLLPNIWDITRSWVDKHGPFGLFLLTGSVNVDRESIIHSGAGRIIQIEMSTMTLYETNDSSGEISLKELFDNPNIEGKIVSRIKMDKIAFFMSRGGWPSLISWYANQENDNENQNIYLDMIKGYVKNITNFENYSKIKPNEKKKDVMKDILHSVSRRCSTQMKTMKVLEDIDNKISRNTLIDYLNYLKEIYVLDELKVWSSKNYRSKTKLLTTPKTYFCDPSIPLYILGINHKNIFGDMKSFGIFFENLVIRDLKVYIQSLGGNIYFFRDENDFEIDAILETIDGRWAAIEIKLGKGHIDDAAKNLLRLKEKTDKQPAFLAVVTAYEFAYQREDGVLVIPIQCLKN